MVAFNLKMQLEHSRATHIIKLSICFTCLLCPFCFRTMYGSEIEINYDPGLVRSFTNDREQEYKNWAGSQLIISENKNHFFAKKTKQKPFEESIENTPYGIKYVIINRDSMGNVIRKTTMEYNNLNKKSDINSPYNLNMKTKRD